MYNQGNYQQYGQRLPPPPPLQPPAPVTPFQHMSPPIPPPAHRIAPNMPPPPPHTQGQHFYRVPAPPLLPGGIHGIQLPPPPTSYFTPAPFGSLGLLPPPPPPPPPSSPPPGPPPLPPSSPPPNPPHSPSSESLSTDAELNPSNDTSRHDDSLNCTAVHGFEMRVKDFNTPAPPLKPRDEKTVRKIEVLCQYIAKNGHEFENMTCQKEVDNPEFKFLFGGSPGSEAAISHEYFKWMKKKCSSSALLDEGHNRDMSLLSNSPAGSDMDMEDDITQPGELGVSSPIKLIQGYASDDSSDDGDDDEPHFENVSPVANDDELHFENVSPVAVSPYGIIESKDSLKEDDLKEDLEKETDSYLMREKVKEEGDDSGCHKHGKLEVDEFGRMVKAGGGSESESDENTRRRGKRGRSRSRSRSPNGRRRRSPWRRRREERSRSRSWSPKKRSRSRSRSRSPYRHRDREEAGADWTRRNKNQLEVCYDFRRGRCFRGSTCRFFHDSEESRWHKNKQHNKDEVDTHEDTQLYQENINTNNDTISQEFVDPQITKTHENSEIYPPYQPPLSSSEHPQPSSLPPPTWNHHLPLPLPLPPPPPRPLLQYPPPLQYPFQAFHPPAGIPVSLYTSQTHYNPYASTFNQPLPTNFSSGTSYTQYDPLFDSIEEKNTKVKESAIENDEFGETGDVENESPISPIDLPDVATGEVEIDQAPKVKKPKDCRSMKLFKVAVAEFVKEVLKPSWRQGNMSKEAFKTIVKKTVDKVSGAMKKHQLPKSQAKINQYIDSSQRKLTKLVMGYVDKYVKV